MGQTRQERFQLLLDQLQFPLEMREMYFNNGEIVNLEVNKSERKWQFTFKVENVLPFSTFQVFITSLLRTFQHIADVSVVIKTENANIEEQKVIDYWSYMIQSIESKSPILQHIEGTIPSVDKNKVMIDLNSLIEENAFTMRYVPQLQELYQNVGFPKLFFENKINDNVEEKAEFLEKKAEEDRQRAMEVF